MLKLFRTHINKEFSFSKSDKLLIAISGGVDSVVLTHLLFDLGYDINLAHCNFKLREESCSDQEFVTVLSKSLGVALFATSFETKEYAKDNNVSIQLAARELRYKWFEDLLEEKQCDYLLTGHHLDDSLETFIINLSRGTGLDGLTGIPKENGNIIRPLLSFSRSAIEKYAVENEIRWVEDASNSEIKYLRNRIRHKITPLLKELNTSFLDNFSKTMINLNQTKIIVDDARNTVISNVMTDNEGVVRVDIGNLMSLSKPRAYMFELFKSFAITEWDDLYNLLSAQSGKRLLTKTHEILKDRDCLFISELTSSNNKNEVYYIEKDVKGIDYPIKMNVSNIKNSILSKKTIKIDEKSLIYPLVLRKRIGGDFFYPTKMIGKKKISKFFKDEKLSNLDKDNTWLLCSSTNEVIWVVGMRQDRRFLASNEFNNLIISVL